MCRLDLIEVSRIATYRRKHPKTPKYIFNNPTFSKKENAFFENYTFIRISVCRSFVWPGWNLFVKLFPLFLF